MLSEKWFLLQNKITFPFYMQVNISQGSLSNCAVCGCHGNAFDRTYIKGTIYL